MEEKSLKEKTAQGLAWGFLNNGAMQLLNLLIGLVLLNFLSRADYGLAGEISIFSAIAAALQEGGFISALTNRKSATHQDYNAVFWFNVTVSLCIYVILWFATPLIVAFFEEPQLLWLSRYAFLGFFMASFSITPRAILFKQLRVKEQTVITLSALVLSGIVSITMAVCGMSYWSIVTQSIVFVTVVSILSWYFSGWRPTLQFSFQPIREMFGFSFKLVITNIFNSVNNNVFSVLFGHFYTKVEVGTYSTADKWNKMGSQLITGMVQGVAQPMFVQVGDNRERLQHTFRKMLRFTSFLSFPALLGLALVAPQLIEATVGIEWLPSARLMRLLCLAGAFMPITALYFNFLISRGRSDVYMWNILAQGLLVILTVCAINYLDIQFTLFGIHFSSVLLMLAAYVTIYVSWLLLWHWFVWRETGLRLYHAMTDVLPFALIAAAVMLATYLLTRSIANLYLLLACRITLAAFLYFSTLWLLKANILRECVGYIRKFEN